jgi:hypothetical protein
VSYQIRDIAGKGRGLVATEAIDVGIVILTCAVVVYDGADVGRIAKTKLGDYNFRFGQDGRRACIALGDLSLCNHAEVPNATLVCDEHSETMSLVAIRPIGAGEEISIRYRRPLWFEAA